MDKSVVLGYGTSRAYLPVPAVLKAEAEWEGGAILREFPTSLGLVLFGTLRDVMLWLLPAHSRASSLFDPASVQTRHVQLAGTFAPEELARLLEVLIGVCDSSVDRSHVGAACVGVAGWAGGIRAPHTELAYIQAGAVALPDCLDHALSTAKLARELSQYRRSETWFRRTIKRARIVSDRSAYVLGYLGLGTLYGRTGNGPAAKSVIELALRQATRWRLQELIGRAHHDLIRVFAEVRNLRAAYDHAAEAGRRYCGYPGQQVRLAADVATLWLRAGASERALEVYEAIFSRAPDRGIKAVWAAQITRSAANSGFTQRYEEARVTAVQAATEADQFHRADAQVQLALADLALGQWDRASAAAEDALQTATLIGAAETAIDAERVLTSARARRRDGAFSDLIREPPALSRIADRLARSLHEAVSA